MMKPIEPAATSLAPTVIVSPVKRETEGLRETPDGIEQIAALTHETSTAVSDFSAKQLEDAINQRVERLIGSNLRLRVESDRDSGKFVYKSVDKVTGEVLRQYPSEKVLRMLAFFKELDGLLYDKHA